MSEYMFEGVLRSPDELMAIATYRAKEIERLTAQLKATEANEQVLVDANKPLLERIAKLEAALPVAHITGLIAARQRRANSEVET